LRLTDLDGEPAERQLAEVLPSWRRHGPVLVQPFLAEIVDPGEWSLLFFDGRLSHAVVKRPASGDFRVQSHHGGSSEAREPSPTLVAAAEEVLRVALPLATGAARPTLYARVDIVVVAGRPLLMELEVIEPALFLQQAPNGAGTELLARAIAGRIQLG
jgi:glutathione synthase/RimK-type ligase-like ATP-grasp enzyme